MSSPVWLITGASSGFGLTLAKLVVSHGHRVVGTVRSKSKSAAAVKELEDAGVKVTEMDLSSGEAAIKSAAHTALQVYGDINILINNAGYGLFGTIEDLSDEEGRRQMETNLFGPVSLIRALIPTLIANKGTIVNISSTAGIQTLPGCSMYSASKMALEGVTEGLKADLEPLGVTVLIVNPGAFRTNFQSAIQPGGNGISKHYLGGPVEGCQKGLAAMIGHQTGDPAKGCEAMFQAVTKPKKGVLRVLLGSDAIERFDAKIKSLSDDREAGRQTAVGCDFPKGQ